ncbi:glycoside hydrolase family 16 protein [Paenarthrobacter sp. NPDC090520]|uniref:glycoside hydrolase family 16 protein n=1 Tax=Paenarthrobacter sp. NPDC090520 TaxID=3364382 RepID=UPI003800E629
MGLALTVAVGLSMFAGIGSAQAATKAAVVAEDPGPVGSFAWEGFNWQKRFWGGAPMYNGSWDANNVSNPDANGYVKLSITNPTGSAPVGAEFQSTREGFGYGTYSTTVEKDVSSLQKEVVWGCLFTYDPNAVPGYTEIDLCEASAWGGGSAYGQNWPVTQGHGYWFDATKPPGQGNNTINFDTTNAPILTHRMVWEPGKITFETFAGVNASGTLLKRTVLQGSTVPVPAKEQIHFNLWVTGGGGGDAAHVAPESVTIRDFSFVAGIPLTAPTPTISGTLTVGSTLTANTGTWTTGTTLTYQWYRSGVAITGATAKTYTLVAADQADTMMVRVTGSKAGCTTVAKYSASTAAVS